MFVFFKLSSCRFLWIFCFCNVKLIFGKSLVNVKVFLRKVQKVDSFPPSTWPWPEGGETETFPDCDWNALRLHPRLTWNLQITQLARRIIFQTSIVGFHIIFSRLYFGLS